MDPELIAKAHAAIARGADPQKVAARFRELTGSDLPASPDEQIIPQEDAEAAALRRTNARGGNALTDFLASAGHGLTFGFDDDVVGLFSPEKAAEMRQAMADRRLLNPGATMASEVAGGVALPAFGAARAARGIASATGSRAAGAVAGGMLTGGAGGFAYGAGDATGGLLERVQAGVRPGAFGALAGGFFGAGSSALGRLGEKTANAVADTQVGQKIADAVVPSAPGAPPPGLPAQNAARLSAQAALRRAIREAGVPEDEIAARLGALGPDAVVADLGPNLGREARAAANQSSALASPTGPIRGLERRAAGRGDRIADELRQSSGLPKNYEESLGAAKEALQETRRTHFGPLEDAYPVVDGPNVADALQDPTIGSVANRVIPGLSEKRRPLSFRELQDVMMELRDDATAARAAGRPNASQKAGDRFETLIDAMRKDIPGFDEAQNAYRVAAKTVDAHEMGRAASHKAPDVIRSEIAALPEAARDGYRQGLLDAYERALRERTTGGGTATGLMNAGNTMRERLQEIAAGDPGMMRLMRGLDRESTYSRTWNALAGNSTTAQQAGDMMLQFVQDIPTSKEAIVSRLLSTLGGLSPAERRQASEILGEALMTGGEGAARLLADQIARGAAGAVGGAAGGAGGVAGPSLFR